MEQCLERGAGLAFPEAAGLRRRRRRVRSTTRDLMPGSSRSAAAHSRGSATSGHRCRSTARQSRGQVLWVEDGDRPAFLAGVDGGGDVVGPRGGGDDGAGGVEDGVDDEVQSLAGSRRTDDEDRVLDRCPDLPATAASDQVADVARPRVLDRGTEGRGRVVRGPSSTPPRRCPVRLRCPGSGEDLEQSGAGGGRPVSTRTRRAPRGRR